MLGKLVNGNLIQPSANERKKIIITNPTDKLLKLIMGYKELVTSPEPEYDMESQYLSPIYEETETEILQTWEVKDIEELEIIDESDSEEM
jgi:hypothetical protein